MKYIRRKPYSFVHFGACSAGKWSMSMIHPITVSNFAVSIVRICTGNIRKRKGKKAFDNSSVTLVEKTSLSQTLWTGGVSIAVRPVGKPITEPNEKRFENRRKKDKCLGIRLIFRNLSYSLNSLKERVYHESYLQSHLE